MPATRTIAPRQPENLHLAIGGTGAVVLVGIFEALKSKIPGGNQITLRTTSLVVGRAHVLIGAMTFDEGR